MRVALFHVLHQSEEVIIYSACNHFIILSLPHFLLYQGVGDGSDRANVFTDHTRNIAGPADGYGIEIADKTRFFGANGHAGPAVDTGIPTYLKDYRLLMGHIKLFCKRKMD